MTWDIFCTVIDNFGDIGVTWRLARQLTAEHGVAVRLWVDDLEAFRRIRPEIDARRETQHLAGVEIRRWTDPLPEVEPGRVVIEALACNLPEAFVARMAAREPRPVWLNLEYLTAESWAKGVHGLPSPHPRLPLTKFFFMPGYEAGTGGLTRENWLARERAAFQADRATRDAFWHGLGVPGEQSGELRISLFSYENAALNGLLSGWSRAGAPVRVMVPWGKAVSDVTCWFGLPQPPTTGSVLTRGHLTVHLLPMLDQDAYDRLLWACDLNFVRGEDSFARAQFAARPLVWQAYRQDDAAHFAKLDAFLDLYCAGLADDLGRLLQDAWHAWNRETDFAALWPAWQAALPDLGKHAALWCSHLTEQADLASNLLMFCEKKLES